jgi:threonine/homoserine/homoserine lactone efflux protein
MTEQGIIHLLSAFYISGVICLAVSVNENRSPRRILRETLRRWLKFLAGALLIALVVCLLD